VTEIPGVPDNYRPTSGELESRLGHLFLTSSTVRLNVVEAIRLCDELGSMPRAVALAIDLRCSLRVWPDGLLGRTSLNLASLVQMLIETPETRGSMLPIMALAGVWAPLQRLAGDLWDAGPLVGWMIVGDEDVRIEGLAELRSCIVPVAAFCAWLERPRGRRLAPPGWTICHK